MNFSLLGKHAVVCGSTQGIGKAAAIALAELGASLVLLARNRDALVKVVAELPVSGDQVHEFAMADFDDPEQVQVAIQGIVQRRTAVQILVNNTGGPPAGRAIDAEIDTYQTAFRHHLVNNQLLARAVVPTMKASGYGRIINIISTSVKQPIRGLGVSNTIRGAVASWSKTLAAELGPFGITVNNVLPGFTDTARLRSLIASKARVSGRTEQEVADEMRSCVPLGRFADPAEVAAAIAFLASPAASYINGINIPVDGGRTECL
jgi:3-oxoacyl-[acyl-carrier protein] reductase